MQTFEISGNIVDIINREIFPGTVRVAGGKIVERTEHSSKLHSGGEFDNYILPGFVDSHVHIESSMLTPSEFARAASVHGTVAVVSDPHEIANVLGMGGIKFMIENGRQVPFKFYFGAPSCVPATEFETSGAEISAGDIEDLFRNYDIKYLSEMMNFPGVLFDSPEVMAKLAVAKRFGKPIDGHAPGLVGNDAAKYISAGISTDHECFSLGEALVKINHGMKILIRQGSAAKNFDALGELIDMHPDMCMLCSDDLHPDDLLKGHINLVVRRAIAAGYGLMNILRAATLNPILHYGLDVGMLRNGDPADFIVIDNFEELNILKTYINGELAADGGRTNIRKVEVEPANKFNAERKQPADFRIEPKGNEIRVIEALDGELITNELTAAPTVIDGNIVSDIERDILKLTVVNRYENAAPACGFIKNFGLKRGAIASSVGHDSHNIISVGTSDIEICKAVNAVIDSGGGLAVVDDGRTYVLPLPVGGLMSADGASATGAEYSHLSSLVKDMGSDLSAPFMTLSFMALLVIPKLKLSDKGLFDGGKFEFVGLQTG